MKWQDATYDYPLPMRYSLTENGTSGVVIMLHGFQDHAHSMLKRLGWPNKDLPFRVLAINAPFPVPVWTGYGFKEAYSWYFRDTSRDLTLVAPSTTSSRLALLLAELNLDSAPKVIVGFSQGGYLAPHLSQVTPNVRGIVTIGCGFILDAYKGLGPLQVHAIHGEKDTVIDLARAQADHAELLSQGHRGSFHIEPGLDHRVDPALEPRVRKLCVQSLEN